MMCKGFVYFIQYLSSPSHLTVMDQCNVKRVFGDIVAGL